jgi:hypothetical protein
MFGRTLIRIGLIVGVAVLAWSVMARTSQAHGTRQVVTVRPYQTLWTIAASHYGGDVRDAIWRIEQAKPSERGRYPGRADVGSALIRPSPPCCDTCCCKTARRMDLDIVFLGTSGSAPTANRGRPRCSCAAAATACSSTAPRAPSGN